KLENLDIELETLASQWVIGVKVEWERLKSSGMGRIPLPTYSFAKERHWVDGSQQRAVNRSSVKKEHDSGNDHQVEAKEFDRVANYLVQLLSESTGMLVADISYKSSFDAYGINSL